MPMLPEIKAQWVAALRSGKYEQGHNALTNAEGKDCCLGVLCKLAVQAGAPVRVRQLYEDSVVDYDGEISFLPDAVTEWSGLESDSPAVKYEDNPSMSLAALNDGEKKEDLNGEEIVREPLTFAQIADLIEADDNL